MAQKMAEANWKLFRGGHHEGVQCVPIGTCGEVYGSQSWHFLTYGYISPSEYNCLIEVRISFNPFSFLFLYLQQCSVSYSLPPTPKCGPNRVTR